MRVTSVAWVLATIMCIAALASYVGKADPKPKIASVSNYAVIPIGRDDRWIAANSTFRCELCGNRQETHGCLGHPDGTSRHEWDFPDSSDPYVRVGDLVCRYPSETAFRAARERVVAEYQ